MEEILALNRVSRVPEGSDLRVCARALSVHFYNNLVATPNKTLLRVIWR